MSNKRASMHDGPLADLFRATDAAKPTDAPREESVENTQMMEPPVPPAAPTPPAAPPVQAAPDPAPAASHIQPVPDPVEAPAEQRPAAAFARGDIKGSPVARDVSSHSRAQFPVGVTFAGSRASISVSRSET